jgi:hypothetical protein
MKMPKTKQTEPQYESQSELSAAPLYLEQPNDKTADGRDAWKNRIVGEGFERPDQLLRNPFNARIHPKFQQDAIEGVLNQVGWVQKILVNRNTGHVVDGHARIEVAISRGEPQVPVTYLDLTPEQERLVLLSLDPIASMAITDAAMQKELLDSVQADENGLAAMLDKLRADTDAMLELEANMFQPKGGQAGEVLTGDDRGVGLTPEQKADNYNTTSIRQVIMYYQAEEYEAIVPRLAVLRSKFGLENNSALLFELVRIAERSTGDEPATEL